MLNGYIFALFGILDYAIFWQNSEAQDLFQVAIRGLIKNLHRYDTGYWNLYDLHPTRRLASPMYLKVHVQLLRILANLTEEQVFGKTADNWLKYLSSPTCRFRWLTIKVLEKIELLFGKKWVNLETHLSVFLVVNGRKSLNLFNSVREFLRTIALFL